MTLKYTVEQIAEIRRQAEAAAYKASKEFFEKELGGVDQFACGFAWVNILNPDNTAIRGNTKLGREMAKAGISKDWTKVHQIWNPAKFPCQNVDTLMEGAVAAANVFSQYGFRASAGCRLD